MFYPRQYTIDEIVTAYNSLLITKDEARKFALDLFTAHIGDLNRAGMVIPKDE